jgi:CBS-domain-containing membrane protein
MIAEGLEGFGELRACIDLGVPMGQGWLLGRPTDEWRLTAPTAAVDQIRGRMLLRDTADVLAPLVATVPVAGSRAEAVEMFATHPAVEHVALVDDHMRPTALLGRTFVARGDASGPPLVAQTSDRVAEVACRAVARDAETRLHPVVCCDERGRFQGIVTVDRLLGALATCDG